MDLNEVGWDTVKGWKPENVTPLSIYLYAVQFSHSVVSHSLQPHKPQHARPPCPSPTPRVYPNSCPLSQWCHLTISSPVIPFSFCLQSSPVSGSLPMSQFFASSIGASASASVLPMNIQGWLRLGLTILISSLSKGLLRVFSSNHASWCLRKGDEDVCPHKNMFMNTYNNFIHIC